MSKRVHNHRDYLSVLSRCSPKIRKAILAEASPELINSIAECVLNVCHGNIPIPKRKKKTVNHYASKILNKMKGMSIKKKHNVLVQNGGFLPAVIIPALMSVIGGLIGKAI